ncbi:hypothetical protein EUTSA_v10014063mg [Eutrema salsugineum]|uniref:Uncharacterized protein n=1 Tax=Eutrema salsugineum TaxID=72664 RepID=V4LQX8_EUTSA|nr:transcription factor RAX1 [Eutrema salsugineum]ESQ42263.1 hypothetical protein EUTSA_v10014063mg [Eutrema salsugineum]
MGRAPCCDKAKVKRGPWSPEEDSKLRDYIEKYGNGGNWISLPLKAGLRRCGKSCRLRWLNYLRPNIKHGDFSEEEDRIIFSLFAAIGSRWSIIAAHLPGRTDNDIKNYWNTKLRKKLLSSSSSSHSSSAMASPFQNPNSQDVKRPLTPSTTIPPSVYNPYVENLDQNPIKSLISNTNSFEAHDQQIFPFIYPNYPQDLSLSDSNKNYITSTSGFLLNHNMCDHYNHHTSFSSDVHGKRSEIMPKQEEMMMMMMIDHHIDQRVKGYNGDFIQGYYNNCNGHGDLKQMISGTGTNSNINIGGSGSGSASSSSSISNLAENKSSTSLLQPKCLPYFYS